MQGARSYRQVLQPRAELVEARLEPAARPSTGSARGRDCLGLRRQREPGLSPTGVSGRPAGDVGNAPRQVATPVHFREKKAATSRLESACAARQLFPVNNAEETVNTCYEALMQQLLGL